MKRYYLNIIYFLVFINLWPSFIRAQNYHWARSVGGKAEDVGIAIAADNSGNTYSIGYYNDTVDFDPGVGITNLVQTCYISGDMFVLKLDSLGEYLWSKRVGGTGSIFPKSITIDNRKNIYITGHFNNDIDFDPDPSVTNSVSSMWSDCFILKLDSSGNYKWCKFIGGPGSSCMPMTIIESDGKLILGGTFQTYEPSPPADFDPGPAVNTLTSQGMNSPFIAKFDTAGSFIWVKGFIGVGNTGTSGYVMSVRTSSLGDVYSGGYFRNSNASNCVDFDPGPGTYTMQCGPGGDYKPFVSKLDVNGNFVWAKAFSRYSNISSSSGSSIAKSIFLDNQENVYALGYFKDTVDFDPTPAVYTLTSSGYNDGFISKFDLAGNLIWVKTLNGPGQEHCNSLAVNAEGKLLVSGSYNQGCDFDLGVGTYSLSCLGPYASYILQLDQNGNFEGVRQLESLNSNSGSSPNAMIMSNGNMYITGEFGQNVDFNPDLGVNSINSFSNTSDAFILKLGRCNIPLDISPLSTICVNQCTTLTASSAGSYTWAGGPYTSEYTVCPTSSTIYSVSGTISSNCIRSNSVMVTVDPCTTISENNLSYSNILIYPNPVKDKLKIDAGSFSVSSITITNVLGQSVLDLPPSIREIDISNFDSGIYFLCLQADNSKKVYKIIKE